MRVIPLARPAPGLAAGHAPPMLAAPAHELLRVSAGAARATAHGLLHGLSVIARLGGVLVLTGVWALAFAAAFAVSVGFTFGVLILMSAHFN